MRQVFKTEDGATIRQQLFQALRRYGLSLTVLAIVVYFIAFHMDDYDVFIASFAEIAWSYVLLALAANMASIMLKVASWKLIFDYSFDGIRGRWRDLTSALMIGFLVNLIIPARLGELARAYVISRRQAFIGKPVSRSTVFGTIVLERVFDGVAMALIVVYGIVRMDLKPPFDTGAFILLAIIGFFALVMVFLEIKREQLQEGAEQASARLKEHHTWWKRLFIRLYSVIARFSEGQKVLRSPRRVAAIFVTTSASWMSQLMVVYFSLVAFGLGRVGILGALLLLILINIAGAIPVTPGNVGVFQLATVIPLTLTYGIPESQALAFSVGIQLIEGSIGLGLGSACLLREDLKFKQVRSGARELEEEVEEELEEACEGTAKAP